MNVTRYGANPTTTGIAPRACIGLTSADLRPPVKREPIVQRARARTVQTNASK